MAIAENHVQGDQNCAGNFEAMDGGIPRIEKQNWLTVAITHFCAIRKKENASAEITALISSCADFRLPVQKKGE